MLKIKRLQLFEFCDQSWLPGVIRELFYLGLSGVENFFGLFDSFPQILISQTDKIKANQVLDLCSGRGGLVSNIIRTAKERNLKLPKIILSDLYPNKVIFEDLKNQFGAEQIGYIEEPLNAVSLNTQKADIDMMSFGFHHLRPEDAKSIITNIVNNKRSLVISEGFQRNIVSLLAYIIFAPIIILVNIFVCSYISSNRPVGILLSLIFPIVPLILYFDGLVSILRTYTFSEIMSMIPEEASKEYNIEYGFFKKGSLFQQGYYFSLLRK